MPWIAASATRTSARGTCSSASGATTRSSTTALDPLSTFAVDVDTASYTLARRYLDDGVLPEKAQVRTEEFVNYFDADVPAPLEETFAIQTELAPSRFGERGGDAWMLRVAVRGKDVTREERQPLALTFVIDVVGLDGARRAGSSSSSTRCASCSASSTPATRSPSSPSRTRRAWSCR